MKFFPLEMFLETNFVKYLISGGTLTPENFACEHKKTLQIFRIACERKINLIQIREKKLPAKLVFELAEKTIEIARNFETKILINERFDIARTARADGVHLTARSIPAKIVRRIFPENFIIGVSAHEFSEIETAQTGGADFATLSPIFPAISKPIYGEALGTEKLKRACAEFWDFPIIALGGIDRKNLSQIKKSGAKGFASIGFLNNPDNLRNLEI